MTSNKKSWYVLINIPKGTIAKFFENSSLEDVISESINQSRERLQDTSFHVKYKYLGNSAPANFFISGPKPHSDMVTISIEEVYDD